MFVLCKETILAREKKIASLKVKWLVPKVMGTDVVVTVW